MDTAAKIQAPCEGMTVLENQFNFSTVVKKLQQQTKQTKRKETIKAKKQTN